jgi:hypothetical protein
MNNLTYSMSSVDSYIEATLGKLLLRRLLTVVGISVRTIRASKKKMDAEKPNN